MAHSSISTKSVPFNIPHIAGDEANAIAQVFEYGTFQGDGAFTKQCHDWFNQTYDDAVALMTPSCSMALDLALLLSGVVPGDEVLIPDYTFVSTAQSVALRGAIPVFCDIREDTLNIDEQRLEEAVTERTRAIIPVHYAGVSVSMEPLLKVAAKHNLLIVEDAAQSIGALDQGIPVGKKGAMSAFSFHASKNIQCGEGGMLLINDPKFVDKAFIAWEKGTNRHDFLRGKVDKYNWINLGSSFLSNELSAAMLSVQLASAAKVTRRRRALWDRYHATFADAESQGLIRRPTVPAGMQHNGHIYYVLFDDQTTRDRIQGALAAKRIQAVPHYPPLHDSKGGRKFGRPGMSLEVSKNMSGRLLRLPMYASLRNEQQDYVIATLVELLDRE